MTDFTTTPLENQFETQIVGEISSGSTVPFDITVKKAISFTPAAGGFYAVLEPGTSKEEVLLISGVSGTTWTVGTRGIPTAKGGSATTTSHGGGSTLIISDNWNTFDDIATAIASKPSLSDNNTWTGTNTLQDTTTFEEEVDFSGTTIGGLRVNNLTTTQRDALTPANGMVIYNTTTSALNQYVGGAWTVIGDTGTVNASTTVAGKVEEATAAEVAAGTAAGATGARLFINPSDTLINEAVTFFDNTDMSGAEAETLTDGSDASALHTHGISAESGYATVTETYTADGTSPSNSGNMDIAIGSFDSSDKLLIKYSIYVVGSASDAGTIQYSNQSKVWDGLLGDDGFKFVDSDEQASHTALDPYAGGTAVLGMQGADSSVQVTPTGGASNMTFTVQKPTVSGNNLRFAWTLTGNVGVGANSAIQAIATVRATVIKIG